MSRKHKTMAVAAAARIAPRGDKGVVEGQREEFIEDEIAKRSFSYWEARGCQGGSAEEDRMRAIQRKNDKVAAARFR